MRMRDFVAKVVYVATFFGFFLSSTAKTPAPIFTQNTSNDAVPRKNLPFYGFRNHSLTFRPPIFPQKRHFCAPFRRIFARKRPNGKAAELERPLIVIVAP